MEISYQMNAHDNKTKNISMELCIFLACKDQIVAKSINKKCKSYWKDLNSLQCFKSLLININKCHGKNALVLITIAQPSNPKLAETQRSIQYIQ